MTQKKPKKAQKRRKQTSRPVRERDSIPWKYCLLTLVCGSFLVVGFFGAARQHFASIDYGIKNSKLRNQIKDLEAEQKRLILTREVAYSPSSIKEAAKKFGFAEMSPSPEPVFSAIKISDNKTEEAKPEIAKEKEESSDKETKAEEKPKLEKTVQLKKKSENKKVPEKIAKKETKTNKDKKEKKSDKPKTNKLDEKKGKTSKKVSAEE